MVALARHAARALGDAAVDHAVADLLFAVIVRGLHPFREHEAKVILRPVVDLRDGGLRRGVGHQGEPRRQRLGLLGRWGLAHHLQKLVAMEAHGACKAGSRQFVAPVPGREQPPRALQQPLRPQHGERVRVSAQEPDVTDQVRPAVLRLDPEVPCERAIG